MTLALVGVACGSDAPETSAAAATDTSTPTEDAFDEGTTPNESLPLRVSWVGALISMPDWVAHEEGFFEARGLDAELVQQQNGPNALAAALVGEVDVFFGPQSNTVTAAEQGECFKYVTSGERNTVNIIARADYPLSSTGEGFPGSIADLKGATIGVPVIGSGTDRNLRLVLEEAGLDPDDDVDIVATGVGATAVAALQEGEVDALASFPPMEQLLDDDEYAIVANLVGHPETSPLADVIISHGIVTCEFLDENATAVERYCQAIWDSFDFANDPGNSERMAEIITPYLGVEPEVATEIWDQYGSTFPTAELTPELWEAQAAFNPEGMREAPPFDEWVYAPCVTSDPRA